MKILNKSVLHQGSEISMSNGDEAGVLKGVASNTHMDKAVFGVDQNGGICMMNEAGTCSFDDKSGAFTLKSGSAKVILKSSGTKIDGQKINIG